jgi:SH3-like domain-containing protein
VNRLAVLLLALLAVRAVAATAYVSDELVLGVYAEQNNQGQRLATLHSGTSVETLAESGDFTQVRLNDGTTGWVKSAFLTTKEPAIVRVKQLEEELDRSRATTPALAAAAARSEVEQLTRQLAAKQAEIDAARTPNAPPVGTREGNPGGNPGGQLTEAPAAARGTVGILAAAVLVALGSGFWLGYATLARRIRHKFGGLKVY